MKFRDSTGFNKRITKLQYTKIEPSIHDRTSMMRGQKRPNYDSVSSNITRLTIRKHPLHRKEKPMKILLETQTTSVRVVLPNKRLKEHQLYKP